MFAVVDPPGLFDLALEIGAVGGDDDSVKPEKVVEDTLNAYAAEREVEIEALRQMS